MEDKNINISKESKFAKYRGKLKDLYNTDRDVYNRLGSNSDKTLQALTRLKKNSAQDLYNEAISNPSSAAAISTAAYYMSNTYASIIDYYKSFFYIRYTVVPRKLITKIEETARTGQAEEEYGKIYYRMIDSVEGINLETTLPSIAEEALVKGAAAIVTEKHKTSDTIVTYFLPEGYFKSIGKTQFGTNIIAFDFKYFDDLKSAASGGSSGTVEDSNFDTILASMPKILQQGYTHYLQDKNAYRWQALDPKVATLFNFNALNIPPRLGAFPASVDYNSYKAIKLDSTAQQLDKILTHQIPTNSDGDLIMDIDEALDVAKNMRASLKEVPEVKLVTTFGKTDLHDLTTNASKEIDVLNSAYNNIYSSAGVDYHVFVSDKDLEVSLKRDKALMWNFYEKVMLFYNVTFNELINFNPYQAKINLLPICVQMEDDDVKAYIEYAGSGIGRLQAVIATGIKQSDLESSYKLEEFLDFDKILKPLQSMYTSSYKALNQKTEEKEDTEEDKDEVPKQTTKKETDDKAVEEDE